jgi:hypothetical protein
MIDFQRLTANQSSRMAGFQKTFGPNAFPTQLIAGGQRKGKIQ